MNAVEEIQAAIEKLTELRGPDPEEWVGQFRRITTPSQDDPIAVDLYSGDTRLIVTLHCTIDAQLAILGAAKADCDFLAESGVSINMSTIVMLGTKLARSINGTRA